MKRLSYLALVVIATLFGTQLSAQSLAYTPSTQMKMGKKKGKASSGVAFEKGKFVVGIGYGAVSLGAFYKATLDSYSDVKSSALGPIFGKLEYGISDKVSMGLNINYSKFSADFKTDDTKNYTGTFKYNSPSIILRTNFHFGTSEKFDPYWGVGVGYRKFNFEYKDNDPETIDEGLFSIPVNFTFEVGVGCRYFFTPNIAAYIEGGITRSPIQFGVVGSF